MAGGGGSAGAGGMDKARGVSSGRGIALVEEVRRKVVVRRKKVIVTEIRLLGMIEGDCKEVGRSVFMERDASNRLRI